MQILYLYDIKAKNKREFNRIKRRFYYHFNKLRLPRASFRTKSVIIIDETRERLLDVFFKGFSGKLEIYKVHAEKIESL